jgi:hypothetical protein
MSVNAANPFPPDALEANRRGQLTDPQLRGLRSLSRYRRKSQLKAAGFLVVMALVIGVFGAPASSAVLRALIMFICLAVAAFLVVRSIGGGDALSRDLRHVQVQTMEGAIGKSRLSPSGESVTTYFLDVGDSQFTVSLMAFDAAPDAGYVRLYFLPQSRKVVNLERLPDRPVEQGTTAQGIVRSLGAAVRSHDRREVNEVRATMAGIGNAMKAALAQPIAPPQEARDTRPLGKAIVGTWSNGLVTATFSADGNATTNILGRERAGRWSVDADGRLHADVTGQQQVMDAWVAGDQLTISAQGTGLTFTRQA